MRFANLIKKADSIFKIGNFYIGPVITANWAVLMNHSQSPNIQSLTGTLNGRPGIYFYSSKEIKSGESLLYDYGKDWFIGKELTLMNLNENNRGK